MKGIAHFAGGVAVASFFPGVIESAACGNPVLFLLGGIFGLLPDTIDFKFARYACRHDIEIAPDPNNPDAQMVAEAICGALMLVSRRRRRLCLKLHTVRLGVDRWLSYRARFRRRARKLEVAFGEIVDAGGNVVGHGESGTMAVVSLPCDVTLDYGYEIDVGFLEGPTIQFRPGKEGVATAFLHWHRSWSHSVLIALVSLGAVWAVGGWLAAVVACLAVMQHVVVDQLGFMGSNYLFPFENRRRAGMRLAASGSVVWNFAFVWTACAVILWNVGLRSAVPAGFLCYAFWSCLIPVSAIALLLRK